MNGRSRPRAPGGIYGAAHVGSPGRRGARGAGRASSRRASASARLHPKGRFVVLEGPDGSGKTTQSKLLREALSGEGRQVVLTREPGGTALGERLRAILLGEGEAAGEALGAMEIGARAELFLFMAARAELVDEVILPALDSGDIVISERFLMSSVVYQGLAGEIPAGEVETIGHSATGGLQPDLVIVLDVDADTGLARVGKADRIEQRGRSYQERVRQGFLSLASRDPGRTAVVDGSRPVAEVHEEILARVNDALG